MSERYFMLRIPTITKAILGTQPMMNCPIGPMMRSKDMAETKLMQDAHAIAEKVLAGHVFSAAHEVYDALKLVSVALEGLRAREGVVVPTKEMWAAGYLVYTKAADKQGYVAWRNVREIVSAMLAAAPKEDGK